MSEFETNTGETHRLSIRRGGRVYRGLWRMTDNAVQVTSLYGVSRAPWQGHERPRALAAVMLGEMAFRWSAQKANH